MATATVPKNQARIFSKIVQCLNISAPDVEKDAGGAGGVAGLGQARKRCWVCAGQPSGAAPTGMAAGDLILDTTNDNVYRYITGTTYVEITATS